MNRNALLVGILMVAVFAVGYMLGQGAGGNGGVFSGGFSGNAERAATTETSSESAEGTTINTASLTDGQRQMLEALGIDADNITITPEMVACAEAKIGAARVEEIKNGASPSFTEGASLLACYR